jgi:tryptophan synthase alpha chain
VVVGSAIVDTVARSLDSDGRATDLTVPAVTALVGELAQGVRSTVKACAA